MKYIFDDAKFTTLVSEYKNSLHENPAAMAAAAMAATKIRNDQGKQNLVLGIARLRDSKIYRYDHMRKLSG